MDPKPARKPLKVIFAFSPGGHLRELETFLPLFAGDTLVYVTDDTEAGRAVTRTRGPAYYLEDYGFHPFKLAKAFVQAWRLLRRERPDLIFSCGAEPAVPLFWLARPFGAKTLFMETVTRFTRPTLTGRAVYPVSDVFLVLQEELLSRYGCKARYIGSLI
jgi:beta-1,4-N-acetylglucosaminyltransferase